MTIWINALGVAGAIAVLLAYWDVSKHGRSARFHGTNFVGALFLACNTAYFHAWPSVALNLAWMAIAVKGLVG